MGLLGCNSSAEGDAAMEMTAEAVQAQNELLGATVDSVHEEVYLQYYEILAREFNEAD